MHLYVYFVAEVYTNIDCVLTDMVHGVPDGFEFWHKGVTTDDLQIAKGIWLERGNLRREDSVVIIDANNITMRMGVYWESFMGAHPDADVCDVVMRMFNSDLYHPCSKDFSIEMMKLDWHCVETQWLMQKSRWFARQSRAPLEHRASPPARSELPVDNRSVDEIIEAQPCGKHAVAKMLFRDAENNSRWKTLGSSGVAGNEFDAHRTLEDILGGSDDATDPFASFPSREMGGN